LLGGLDLSASLAAGRPIARSGVLSQSDGGLVILSMAERIEPAAAARIATAIDLAEVAVERDGLTLRLDARIGVIAFDEGLTPEERPPRALLDRLAFHLDLSMVGAREAVGQGHDPAEIASARASLAQVEPADYAIIETLCVAARSVGVACVRAPLLTLRAARAHAALEGRNVITAEDAAAAARLVLGPRARARPADPTATDDEQSRADEADAPPPEAPPESPLGAASDRQDDMPSDAAKDATDMVIAAIQAVLPDAIFFEALAARGQSRASARSGGAGAASKSAQRGRPVGSRPGALRLGARLNLVDTLRAAAPWQTLRGGAEAARIQVRQEDFRIRRFVQRLESTTIFVVDASGSSALQRLGEAKGAVELLLAKAYVSRARVALIAFRGTDAELLLPPTRSLTRAKMRLAELPGGGGTPLAAGLDAALTLALAERAKDHTPLVVLLTDGRGNIARDGAPGRAQAQADAFAAARQFGEARIAGVFIDTSPRAQPDGARLAQAMDAAYAPLPYVNAAAVADLVGQLQSARR
jgi:magnesium chelatase subunit D